MKGELEELKAKYPDAEGKLQKLFQDLYFSESATHAQASPGHSRDAGRFRMLSGLDVCAVR